MIEVLFGSGRDLNEYQMAARAVVVFALTLALIRISGRRSFGQRSPFDYVVAILLGATLSRVIVGASPAVPTAVASLVIVVMHRLLAWGCVHSRWLEKLVGGVERELIEQSLARTGGNREQAARLLTMKRTTLVEKLKRMNRSVIPNP